MSEQEKTKPEEKPKPEEKTKEEKTEDKNSSDSNNNNKIPKKPTLPKTPFNFYWIYGIIAVALIAMEMMHGFSGGLKEMKQSDFYEGALKEHHVVRIVVIPSENIAEIYIGQEYLSLLARQGKIDAFKEGKSWYTSKDAVINYTKASKTFEFDEALSSEYLFRAALLSSTIGKSKEAVSLFKELKEKFPKTEKASQADKYINTLVVEKADL